MSWPRPSLFLILILLQVLSSTAHAELCDASARYCGLFGGQSSGGGGGSPSRGSKIRINPSAVPIEKGLGLEFLYFDGSVDFALVKGLGRIGAAISPSNSEETFFGPPGFELPLDLLLRKQAKHKLESQKYTLATAIGLFSNKRSGLQRAELNVGLMGKYNTLTKSVMPGGGVTGVLGPFTFGYSAYKDQTQIDYASYGLTQKDIVDAHVETYSVGAFLNSLAIDYSLLREITTEAAIVTVLTGTLMLKKALLTASVRRESSSRPYYNFSTQMLDVQTEKTENFFGAQVFVGDNLMLGAFYNFYLLREYSVGATLFF